MLHGILPHNHHEHEAVKQVTELHSHDHDSHTHHHHDTLQTSDDKGFLEKALGNHAHEANTNFPSEISSVNTIQLSLHQEIQRYLNVFDLLNESIWEEKISIPVNRNVSFSSNYHLQNLFQRGPPSLV